jgi:hypothetical protein
MMINRVTKGLLAVLLVVQAVPTANAQDAVDCTGFLLEEDALWLDFSAALDENGIPVELWNRLLGEGVMSLEDYGITGDELQAFFEANGEKIDALTDNNPLRPYLQQALAIMGGYGLGSGDIDPLLSVRQDMPALFAALAARGLDADRADAFLNEIAPIVREVIDRGLLKYSRVLEADLAMDQVNTTLSPRLLADYIDDLDALGELLVLGGSDPQAVEAMIADLEDLKMQGLDLRLLQNYEIESQRTQLAKYGLPSAVLQQVVGSSQEAFAECLSQLGFDDPEGLSGVFDVWAIDPADFDAYLIDEMAGFLALSGLSPEDFALLYDLTDEELLAVLYETYEQDYADWLYAYLMNSTFFELGRYGWSDDELWEQALLLSGEFEEEYYNSLLDDYISGYFLDALLALDEDEFAFYFDDPEAFLSWFEEQSAVLFPEVEADFDESELEENLTEEPQDDTGGETMSEMPADPSAPDAPADSSAPDDSGEDDADTGEGE